MLSHILLKHGGCKYRVRYVIPAFRQDTTWSGCGSPTAMADLDQLVLLKFLT